MQRPAWHSPLPPSKLRVAREVTTEMVLMTTMKRLKLQSRRQHQQLMAMAATTRAPANCVGDPSGLHRWKAIQTCCHLNQSQSHVWRATSTQPV
jgi:hypothetical protein